MIYKKEEIIKKLNLKIHPEGGYYSEIYRDKKEYNFENGNRNLSTAIYYLLDGKNFSAFHRIKSDECWNYYSGNTYLKIYEIRKDGKLIFHKLGDNLENEEKFFLHIEKESWFASKLNEQEDDKFALFGCTVTPGFDFKDFELAKREKLIKEFPEYSYLIEELTN